jgi:hypothetical protein
MDLHTCLSLCANHVCVWVAFIQRKPSYLMEDAESLPGLCFAKVRGITWVHGSFNIHGKLVYTNHILESCIDLRYIQELLWA